MGLSVTDRISLAVYGSDALKEAWDRFSGLAASETLAAKYEWVKTEGQAALDAEEEPWLVRITRIEK
jgi:hypothetical protein